MIEVEASFLTPEWLKKLTLKLSSASLPFQSKFHRFSFHKQCFSGYDLVSWLMCNTREVCTREAGVVMSQILLQCGIIEVLGTSFNDSSKSFYLLGKNPSFDVVQRPRQINSDKEKEENMRPKLLDFSKIPKEWEGKEGKSQLLDQGYVYTNYFPMGSFIVSRFNLTQVGEETVTTKSEEGLLLVDNPSPLLFSCVSFPFIISVHKDSSIQFFHVHGKWSRRYHPIGWNMEDMEGIFFNKSSNILIIVFKDRIVNFKMPSKSNTSLNSLPYWNKQSSFSALSPFKESSNFISEVSLGGFANCSVITTLHEAPPPSKYYSHLPDKFKMEWEEEIPYTIIEFMPEERLSLRFELCKLIEEEKGLKILLAWNYQIQIWDLNPLVVKRVPDFETKDMEYIITLAYYKGTLVTSHSNSSLNVRNILSPTSKTQTIKLNREIHSQVQAEVVYLDDTFLYIGDTAGLVYFCRRDNGRLVTVMQSEPLGPNNESNNDPVNPTQENVDGIINGAPYQSTNQLEHPNREENRGEEETNATDDEGRRRVRGNYHPLSILPRNITFIRRIGRWVFVGTQSSHLFILDIKSAADSAAQDPRARKELKWEPHLSYKFPYHACMENCLGLNDSLLLHFTRSIPVNPEDSESGRTSMSYFVKWAPSLIGLNQSPRVTNTPFMVTISHLSERIWNILADAAIAHNEDLGEFLSIMDLISGVISNEKLIFESCEEGATQLEDLSKQLDEYLSTLTKLQSSGTLMKYLIHNRLRKRMVQLNSKIHVTVQSIKKAFNLLEIFNVTPIRLEQRRREFTDKNGVVTVPEPFEVLNEEEEEGDSDKAEVDGDPEFIPSESVFLERRSTMFASIFGSKPMVEWDVFVSWLNTQLEKEMSEPDLMVMKHILDNAGTGFVSRVQFGYFLNGFGPIQQCIENVHEILSQGWFQGFLSSSEARLLIQRESPGTFLIRFSSSKPGSFAIAFKSKSSVHHILIHSSVRYFNKNEHYHFALYEEATGKMKNFDSVGSIVSHYCNVLTTPYSSTLPKARWFQGDLTGEEASDLLRGNNPGTYLIRFNSTGHLAASYVDPEGFIKHTVITQDPTKGTYGILLQNGSHMWFKDVNELVAHCYQIGIFFIPIKNVSSIFVSDRPARRVGRQMYNNKNRFETTSAEALIAISNPSKTDYRGMTYLSIFTEK
eukprot:TRINITY_DN5987_c0_g1_i2.p1 TRINITY_DN5987_c0_g1~~TRINITY_DN5987_c0_g1_i2.p1  ORF type:complete len:1175 (+),score=294.85 TRINITY_DN5987_c0_g1_i2:242-3766(+)